MSGKMQRYVSLSLKFHGAYPVGCLTALTIVSKRRIELQRIYYTTCQSVIVMYVIFSWSRHYKL